MTSIAAALKFDGDRFSRAADWLAVAVAVTLPWSTSATGICVVLWLLALLPTLEFAAVRRAVATPAGALPVLLVALAVFGMLWSEVPWTVAFSGFAPFAKLLIIPLLLVQYRRSEGAMKVFMGYFFSCSVLLAVSMALAMWPVLGWERVKGYAVPVKDYIAQSGEFMLCAFAAVYIAIDRFKSGSRTTAIILLLFATAFLFNIFYITSSRTALVVIPVLLVLLGWRQAGWRGAAASLVITVVLGWIVWWSSRHLQERMTSVTNEVEAYQVNRDATSVGFRLDFWKKSLTFIAEAPVIGHGTGSTKHIFEKAAAGATGDWAIASANPHNQFLAVAIQLGLLGGTLLLALWVSHLLLFRQPGLVAWVGLIVVAQNIVSSLFNSHLFDFNQGWTYVFGVGVAGGMMLRSPMEGQQEAPEQPRAAGVEGLPPVSGAQAQRPV